MIVPIFSSALIRLNSLIRVNPRTFLPSAPSRSMDWWDSYTETEKTDPAGASTGYMRVVRGKCWYNLPEYLRSAHRFAIWPVLRVPYAGFRVVRY